MTQLTPMDHVSTLREQVISYCLRVRYRTYLVAGLVLMVLSGSWLYGTSSMGSIGRVMLLKDKFTAWKGYHSTWNEDSSGSNWAKPRPGHSVPPKIWQIMLSKKKEDRQPVDPKALVNTKSWLAMNQDYTYTLVGEDGGRDFVQRHFGHDAALVSTYNALPNVGMRSDLLRYLILDVEGGVYTDTDTVALKPIDDWVPRAFRNRTRLVVGIEFDQQDGVPWVDISHVVQFCQWTIAAAPGHAVFKKMASRVVRSLADLERTHGATGNNNSSAWKPTSFEVMNSTGPAAWTDVVWEVLQEADGALTDLRNLSYMASPTLFGDVLVLPIDGFGMGQLHSGSTSDGTIPDAALVKHLFGGTWRGQKR
ncbi:Initiation-specific alpha-1,6-mannosyltransferase [Colletotrichum tanaceti]|uniref:Initiation-specific alpha-1,6-mannosyltransferase n=1 Tax=Colletotrichum tanaceti TaxID=1306861 RepID=A0A4U6WY92_9PEZI|nr:Initiation-specific alpha-1,6-mannosyltransferase [Colletotrichum tanaceti]TKW48181.1 Initiation-specific alpha-1,6-mannosyltransferase [Colletotrichum tanaceti]